MEIIYSDDYDGLQHLYIKKIDPEKKTQNRNTAQHQLLTNSFGDFLTGRENQVCGENYLSPLEAQALSPSPNFGSKR